MAFCVSYLVDVLCKSVGVLLAAVHAGDAGAPSRGPAAAAAAASLTGADRGSPSGGAPTWLPVRGPGRGDKDTVLNANSISFAVTHEQEQ